ncbi:MAG: LCP family protein [Oscillochloris sp.]|nr:LCP family protein [Oscillochloris sp.]
MPTLHCIRPSARTWIGISLLAFLGVGLILLGGTRLVGVAVSAQHNLEALIVTSAPVPARARGHLLALPTVAPVPALIPTTILLLGSDRRPGETAIPRSDAIILLRIDPVARRVALLSLPRDLWVNLPGYGQNRLNAAYLLAEHDGPPGAGMALARATVSDLIAAPIDYVAVVDFRGFIGLIDAIDGIMVDVPTLLVDTRFPTADNRFTTVRFAPGLQPMDGATALTYCRVRHPDDDFARQSRQQSVLLAIAARFRARGTLDTMLSVERISAALVGFVQTDMPRDQIVGLVWVLRDLDLATVEHFGLSDADVSVGVGRDRYALTAHPGAIADLAANFLGIHIGTESPQKR